MPCDPASCRTDSQILNLVTCCCREVTKPPARLQQLYTSDTETEPPDLHAESEDDEALLAPALRRAGQHGQQQSSQQPAGTDDDTEPDAQSPASGQQAARAGGSQKRKLPVVEGQVACFTLQSAFGRRRGLEEIACRWHLLH